MRRPAAARQRSDLGAFRIGRIAGIDILVHYSWFFIFFLLTWWLSEGFYQKVYDDWSAGEA